MYGTTSTSAVDLFDRMFRGIDDFSEEFKRGCCNTITLTNGISIYENKFPPMNVQIKPDTKDLLFEFALSGYSKDEMSVDFDEDYLCLKLEPKEPEEKKTFIKHGIRSSKCEAKYFVPSAKYDVEKSNADFKDGILSIFIPAKEEIKPKRILIGGKKTIPKEIE